MKFDLSLYLVTERYHYTNEKFLSIVDEACKSGVTIVQLREKTATTKDFYILAKKIKEITDSYGIPLIINDRVDICLAVNASGVHVGDDELPIEVARKILGPDKIIGVSVKNKKRAEEAKNLGADYFGVGAFFHTNTKDALVQDKETLTAVIRHTDIPVVAIGGLKENNLDILKDTGVKGAAFVSEIMKAHNVEKKVKSIREKINFIIKENMND